MKLSTLVLFALGGFSSLVASQANTTTNSTVFTVTVGLGGRLLFNPQTIFAPVGATVQFAYYPQNHSVAQSSFESPCAPLDNGIFSGYVPVSANQSLTSFVISINDTNPIYLYCSQMQHCQAGMVAIINPSATESFPAFEANAAAASANVEPTNGVQGGSLIQNTANNATTTGTGSPTATGGGVASGTGSATASDTATGTESGTASGTGTATETASGGAASASATTGAGAQVLGGGLLGGLGVVAGLGLGLL
ncbi:MAG: hypothetical protein Q9187_006511 [Circinaria calcarea]